MTIKQEKMALKLKLWKKLYIYKPRQNQTDRQIDQNEAAHNISQAREDSPKK